MAPTSGSYQGNKKASWPLLPTKAPSSVAHRCAGHLICHKKDSDRYRLNQASDSPERTVSNFLVNVLAAPDDDMIGEILWSEVMANPGKVAGAEPIFVIVHADDPCKFGLPGGSSLYGAVQLLCACGVSHQRCRKTSCMERTGDA